MTALLDQADLTWTHTAPQAAERRRGVPAVLFVAGMTAATCTMGVPVMVTDLTSVTAIPASHMVSEVLSADHNIGAQVRELKVASGLTWAQFAALFGVTRRAVHFWVEGGKISADHLVRVERIRGVLERLGGTSPEATRAVLFSIGSTGRTPFAALVSEVNRTGDFTPERSPLGIEEASIKVGIPGTPVSTEEFSGIKLRKW